MKLVRSLAFRRKLVISRKTATTNFRLKSGLRTAATESSNSRIRHNSNVRPLAPHRLSLYAVTGSEAPEGSVPDAIMNVGTEWLVDAEGCSAELLRDADTVGRVCEEIIADLGLRVVGEPIWHQFPSPGGVTALYLLTESHLACHTYPETGIATFNLYCCRARPEWQWQRRLCDLLGANLVTVRMVARGSESTSATPSFVATYPTSV